MLGRFCCLYDTPEIPEVFKQHQNYKVFAYNSDAGKQFRRMHDNIRTEEDFYESVPLQRFLREFYANPSANPVVPAYIDADSRATRISIAKSISEAFDANAFDKIINEHVLQHRLDIHITSDLARTNKGKPDFASMLLTGQKETLSLFGLVPTSDLKWANLRKIFGGHSTAWMDEIELGIEGVVGEDHGLPCPIDVTFTLPTSEHRHFRPVLARFQEFQKGSYNFFVSLYESTHRQLNDAELLISGMTLGSEFKDLINDKEIFDSTIQDDNLVAASRKLRRQLALIEGESSELDLTNPAKLRDALSEKHKSEADDFFNQWKSLREKWLKALSKLEATKDPMDKKILMEVYEELKPINIKFLVACAESYLEEVKE